MSLERNGKTLIIVLTALVVLCMCSTGGLYLAVRASQMVSTDPADVAASIATYTAPAGYNETIGFRLGNVSLVGLTCQTTGGVIMLAQVPMDDSSDQAELERQLSQAVQQQGGGSANLKLVGYQDAVIRGQPVKMTVSEGRLANGTAIRQVAAVFEGDHGLVMVMIMAPTEGWSQRSFDAFLASIQ